jgi:hypothetical protein
MIRQHCSGISLLLFLTVALPLAAQEEPDYGDPTTAVAACEKLHKAGLGDKSFIDKMGPKHHLAWKAAAEAGDPAGQWLWGRCMQEGAGVPAQPAEAAGWYAQAVRQGFGLAMNELGEMYEQGIAVKPNPKSAVAWYRHGMAKGCGAAAVNLGRAYMQGKGVERDYLEAAKCFQAAAKAGYADGARGLGEIAEYGRGVTADKKTAARWYREAVALGSQAAQRDLQRVERGSGAVAGKPPATGQPPAVNKPPPDPNQPPDIPAGESQIPSDPKFKGRPVPGIAVHPLGAPGIQGPAPAFAGKWTATLRNEESRQDEALTYTFDAQGVLLWEGKVPVNEVDKKLQDKTDPNPQIFSRWRTWAQFVSVQPTRAEYLVWQTHDYSAGNFSNTKSFLKRLIFTPVAGNTDRLHVELWINDNPRPAITGELVRAKGD